MPSEALELAGLLGGPSLRMAVLVLFVVAFILGLIVDQLWLFRGLRRDVGDIKADLSTMKGDIRRAQQTADEAGQKSEMTAQAVEQAMQVVSEMHTAVLNLPEVIVKAMGVAANGR